MFRRNFTKTNSILFLILLLAAFLRFYRIGEYMTFLGDEGRDVLTVYNILHGHLTLLGPTSSVGGFFLGPIYYYFMAPFLLLFNYNPVGPAVMIGIFGVITVYLVYFLGEHFFNKITGIIAAFIYTISPLVIIYSRSSWNPNPMPIFTILCLISLYFGIYKNKLRYLLLSGIFYGILLQLHYIETFLGVSIFIYVLVAEFIKHKFLDNKKISWILKIVKDFLVFIIGFLVGFAPYIAFEFRHKFVNTLNIIKFIFHSPDVGSSGNFLSKIWDVLITIFGKTIFYYPPTTSSVGGFGKLDIFAIVIALFALIAIIYLFYLFLRSLKNLRDSQNDSCLKYLLLIVWLIIPIILFGFYKKNIYDYYFEFLYPVVILVVSSFLAFLLRNNFRLRVLGIILSSVILFIIVYLSFNFNPLRVPPNNQVLQTELISKKVLNQTNNLPFNFALITGGNSDFAYRYYLTVWGHPPITIQPPYLDPKRTTVTNQLIVVCESIPCFPLGNSLFEIAGFGQAEIIDKTSFGYILIYKLGHYKASN